LEKHYVDSKKACEQCKRKELERDGWDFIEPGEESGVGKTEPPEQAKERRWWGRE
jgi:predicted Fe-S protein YdhL (DUF1289 family)